MNMTKPEVVIDMNTREQLLTVQEFADRARLHPMSVYRLIKKNKLRGVVRIGTGIRIKASVALSHSRA